MRLLVLLLLVITLYNCNLPERQCKDYKTGSFYFEYSHNGETKRGYIERTETLQIERYDTKIDSSEVRWVNDCEVIFKTINPKRMVDKKDIHLKIITTTDSSYSFEYSYVGKSKKQKGTAVVSTSPAPITIENKSNLFRITENTLVHDSDSLSSLEINDGKITMLYKGRSLGKDDRYDYKITSQKNTLTHKPNYFLELTNETDTLKYEILENSKTNLSLMYLPTGKIHHYSTKN
ncbi:hypothetical protein N7U66_01130 [Lacinutrix neustonica]|uniref:DNA topoisomerase IV n=1 Tax=Lacinutrix neustonica TaxID=2980107 RepID=A0A9E8MVJ9_9FLAO|nr:hypothetical protein [Lacinutrix neustonica]WAC02368.1 hypothetical protein N7U66_01130 [Lacinutrix neustonica]